MATRTWTVRTRDALAAATVWLPFLTFLMTWVLWADDLPTTVTLRNDLNSENAAALPVWLIAIGLGVVLLGAGIGASSVVPEGPNDSSSRRTPLFWAGAVAGFTCAIWIFQSWAAMYPPADPSRFNALAGFATIGAALYGLLPFSISKPPSQDTLEHDSEESGDSSGAP
ncbi:hypothetical protein [Salinibacterium sp. ZJ450]|uniref:hypothetical protein n=1 Tax=Salinibacterium sp. ZJ450 TaxID=2708338 RepID=UPI00141F1393|nr:hypothetical protein [Salinibacterium sp. ZJ450]